MREPIFNAPIAICTALLIAWIVGFSWALSALRGAMSFENFMAFCVATFAIMVTGGYAWDHFQARKARHDRQSPR
jgi:F0F1-type ATP synthase assembly protein I